MTNTQAALRSQTLKFDGRMLVGPYTLTGDSALALEVLRINPRARRALHLTDGIVLAIDVIVSAARSLLDVNIRNADSFDDIFPSLEGVLVPDWEQQMEQWTQGLTAAHVAPIVKKAERRARRVTSSSFHQYLRRMLGAATYDRVYSALQSDAAVLTLLARRLIKFFMPLAVDIDDCVAVLSDEQISAFEVTNNTANYLLAMIVSVDSFVNRLIDGRLPLDLPPDQIIELRGLEVEDVEQVADQIHDLLKSQTRERLKSLSALLDRKLQGAEDALDNSVDGAAQAATSLVEFIDRMLRSAFDDHAVLDWIDDARPDERGDLTYEHLQRGVVLPTKRASALCFAYAGDSATQPSPFNDIAALSLNTARNKLQKIKHADQGTEEEVAQIRECMTAVRAYFHFVVTVGWASVGDPELDRLRERLP